MTIIRERIYQGLRQVQRQGFPTGALLIHMGREAHAQYLKEFYPTGFGKEWEEGTPLGLPVVENPALGDYEIRLRYEVYA